MLNIHNDKEKIECFKYFVKKTLKDIIVDQKESSILTNYVLIFFDSDCGNLLKNVRSHLFIYYV